VIAAGSNAAQCVEIPEVHVPPGGSGPEVEGDEHVGTPGNRHQRRLVAQHRERVA
jgi:hypothetical protein